MATINVNERTRFSIEITFLEGSVATQPLTARWKAYCATSDTELTGWADLTVPSSGRVILEIPASLTRNISGAVLEEKIIATEANYGTDDQVSEEQVILVKNLRKTD